MPTIVPTDNFNTVLYTGDGTTSQGKTGVGFQPNFTWIKNRSSSSNNNALFDSVRGIQRELRSDTTGDEIDYTATNYSLKSFDIDGFTVGDVTAGNYNVNGAVGGTYSGNAEFVAWNWKAGGAEVTNDQGSRDTQVSANTDAGFSIVTLDKPNTNTDTYGHSLSEAPELIILKRTASADDWYVYSKELGNTVRLSLNSSAAKVTGTGVWGSTTPTSSVFTLQNQLGGAHVAYCFHSVDGYSKIGSYKGTGASGNTIVTGFRPAFVIIKRTEGVHSWLIYDNKRDPSNPVGKILYANESQAENPVGNIMNFLSNGFELTTTNTSHNESGGTYIFMAFAE